MSTRRSSRLGTARLGDAAASGSPPTPTKKAINGGRKRKSVVKDNENISSPSRDVGPSTPKRKKVARSSTPESQAPTPAVTKLLSIYHGHGDGDGVIRPPVIDRLAVPGGTNAQLVSPETRRLVSTKPLDQVSPSKKTSGTTSTKNILDAALEHLIKTEPKLKPVIEKHPCNVFSEKGLAEVVDPFSSLVSGILSQQVRAL